MNPRIAMINYREPSSGLWNVQFYGRKGKPSGEASMTLEDARNMNGVCLIAPIMLMSPRLPLALL